MPISSGAEEVYSLPEMVVTAEKMPVESKKEPQAVQVVDQKEIESLGAVNATQALELVTGNQPFKREGRQHGFHGRHAGDAPRHEYESGADPC